MDVASAVAAAIAAGAESGLRDDGNQAVREAYGLVKTLLRERYGQIDVQWVEQKPASDARRAALAEDLAEAQATDDNDLLQRAHVLAEVVQRHAGDVPARLGIDMRNVRAHLLPANADQRTDRPTAINMGGMRGSRLSAGPMTITNVRQARNVAIVVTALAVAAIALYFLAIQPMTEALIRIGGRLPVPLSSPEEPIASVAGAWEGTLSNSSFLGSDSVTMTISADGSVKVDFVKVTCNGDVRFISGNAYVMTYTCASNRLGGSRAVTLNLTLSDDRRTLVISGPNGLGGSLRKS